MHPMLKNASIFNYRGWEIFILIKIMECLEAPNVKYRRSIFCEVMLLDSKISNRVVAIRLVASEASLLSCWCVGVLPRTTENMGVDHC